MNPHQLKLQDLNGQDARFRQLVEWLTQSLNKTIDSIEFASEDASFRRYFRIFEHGESYIVMDAPVEHMDLEPYVRIARTFGQCGMNVPEILEIDYRHGFAIITDFGNRNYLDILDDNCANDMYEDALNALVRLQTASLTQLNLLTPYDTKLLQTEMNLFHQWYLPKQVGTQQITEIYPLLNETYEMLIAKALEQPKVWVHLDYHSRNLMYVKQNNPGIIDFQDAVTGPVTYDLVSLLKDCYIRWPQPRVEHWIEQYLKKTAAAGIPIQCDTGQFMEWFDWM